MDDPELSGGTEDVVKIDLEMDDAEEPRSLAEFFPARFDEKIGAYVYYDNRLSREPHRVYSNEPGRKLPCDCGSGRRYAKCCYVSDARKRSPREARQEDDIITHRLVNWKNGKKSKTQGG